MYHAFDSPPKILISEVLERMGTPLKLLRLIQTVLEHGSTLIRGSPDAVFRTTHGVKKGCPLACFLFVLVFQIPLRYLRSQGLTVPAYVDDVSTHITRGNWDLAASQVQQGLNLICCQLNVAKSECLPLLQPPPMLPSLPKSAQPPDPVQAGPVFWTVEPCVSLPEWADTTEHPMLQVSHLMHLGHPLRAYMAQTAGYKIIVDEFLNQLADLNAHPIQTLDRMLLVNTVVLPRLLYRCECYPLTNTQLQELSWAMERFVFAMSGLPSLVAKKTLYTHRSWGLVLGCLQIVYPTRVLDSLHRNPLLDTLRVSSPLHISQCALFGPALSLFGPTPSSSMLPLTVSCRSRKALRGAYEIASVAGLVAYVVPNSCPPPDYTYTDGSRIGSPPASGVSAVLRDGRIVLCRVPGNPNSYKAEVVRILLGSHFCPP